MAYWDAGQRRVAREARDRLAAGYLSTRDALFSMLVSSGLVKATGDHVPKYAQPDRPAKGLRQLVHDFGAAVDQGSPEFRH